MIRPRRRWVGGGAEACGPNVAPWNSCGPDRPGCDPDPPANGTCWWNPGGGNGWGVARCVVHLRHRGERCAAELAGRRVPVGGPLGQRLGQHRLQRSTQRRVDLAQRRRRRGQVREHPGGGGVARERHLPRQRLEQHTGQRVLVGPTVDVLALQLLGRDVGQRPDDEAGLRHAGITAVLRDAEVGEVGVPAPAGPGDQDVRRLHVAVHKAARVRGVEGVGDLRDHLDGVARLHPAPAGDHRREVGALDEPHREVDVPVVLTRVVDRHHVRMVEGGGDAGLAAEPLPELRVVGQLRVDDLHGHGAVQRELVGLVDHAHPAAAGHGVDPQAADDGADVGGDHRAIMSGSPAPGLGPLP